LYTRATLLKSKDLRNLMNWNFDWVKLNSANSEIYKLTLNEKILGLVKHEWQNENHFRIANIEISPSNIGSKGNFKNAAELLFAYSALMSFKYNKGAYNGFLAFKSKGRLIKHYEKKYNAQLVFRENMIISPKNCKTLIKNHLKIEI